MLSLADRWLLPEGVEEVLPPRAAHLEAVRRTILDLFQGWGYELVIPPLVEYLESLLTGLGHDLDLQTFKITDQLTGRLMGIRADMTPQVARIDAHRLKRDVPTRLCYLGPVLHTLPSTFAGSRNPFQIGAELYGHDGPESDAEVLCLMLEILHFAGIGAIVVDLGHMGIFRGLARQARLDSEQESLLFEVLQRKATPEIAECLRGWRVPPAVADRVMALVGLNGEAGILGDARKVLAGASPEVLRALGDLERIAALVGKRAPGACLHFDLAELRGYHYHTGVVFAAYTPGQGQALAKGGRYNDIGRVFGRARPATGFSTDLRLLASLSPGEPAAADAIYAPWADESELLAEIAQLRRQGRRVICALPGQQGGPEAMGCGKRLELRRGRWTVLEC